jgi:uncharacterized protein (TIGR03083 family)
VLLTPRYGDHPVLSVEVRTPGDHPILRQRRRLEELLTGLSPEEWQQPSRCAGWTVQDVVTHLVSTNGFWALSIQAGLRGQPTQLLAAFDPVVSPAQMVDQVQGTPVEETLEGLMASHAALTEVVDGLAEADWDVLAEAPPGHLPVWLVADHALWDCWVHERDIVLPLGHQPVEEPDEVLTCLRYAAALGRAFEACRGTLEPGTVVLDASDPDARVVVTAGADAVHVGGGPVPSGAARGEGDAVTLLEMLSARDAGQPVPTAVDALTAGLATVFDQHDSA